jgi:hypothetical protein
MASRGISINLLTYRFPTISCWSGACLTGMGGCDSLGNAWRWDVPLACRGKFTLSCLEYAASIITIQNALSSISESDTFFCILSLLDSTSAIGWLHSSSFIEITQAIPVELACHLASLMLNRHSCLYSQHIKGSMIIIADSLSHDFHICMTVLCDLMTSTF